MADLLNTEIALPRVLYETWKSLPADVLQNESTVAFALCKNFSHQDPTLEVQFEGWRENDQQGISTLIVYSKDHHERGLFILKLIPASRLGELLPSAIGSLRSDGGRHHTFLRIPRKGGTPTEKRQIKLTKFCNLGLVILPDTQETTPVIDFRALLGDPEISARIYVAYCDTDRNSTPIARQVFGLERHAGLPASSAYPNIEFALANGRKVQCHALVIEPTYDEHVRLHSTGPSQWVPLNRRRTESPVLFGWRTHHHVHQEPGQQQPGRLPNMAVRAWLSSAPIVKEAVFSDLSVLFFVEFDQSEPLASMLARGLHSIAWETHAIDVHREFLEHWEKQEPGPTTH